MVDFVGMGILSNSVQWIEVINVSGGVFDFFGWVLCIEDINGNSLDYIIGVVMFLQDGCILFVNGFDFFFDGVILLDVQYMDIVMCVVGVILL